MDAISDANVTAPPSAEANRVLDATAASHAHAHKRAASVTSDALDATEDEREESPAPRQSYKSMKKKYRKIRAKFDQIMRESDVFYKQEQDAIDTVKRLGRQNDQLLDMLLDLNNASQVPAAQRFDLSLPEDEDLPPYISDADLEGLKTDTPEGRELYDELRALIEERSAAMVPEVPPAKSLSQLAASIPHRSLSSGHLPSDLMAEIDPPKKDPPPLSYLSLDQLDDYLYDFDVSIGIPILPSHAPLAKTNSTTNGTSNGTINGHSAITGDREKELHLRNPNSVYNWLRKHEPGIFLQDGEAADKSSGKAGSLRGAGKRAAVPAPSRADVVEFVEEDGMSYGSSIKEARGKRKREKEEDAGYRPSNSTKSSAARPSKKKRKSESDAFPASTGTGKGRKKARDSDIAMAGSAAAEAD